jgi:hypothetical protein
MLEIPMVIKSLGVATTTGTITNVTAFLILTFTKNPILSIMWIQTFGNIIAYFAQSYIYGFKRVIGGMILRWALVTCISMFLSIKLFQYINNLERVKKWKSELTGLKLDVLNYTLLLSSIMIVYFIWEFKMRKKYIFVYREADASNTIDLVILLVAGSLVAIDQYYT